MTYKVLVLGAKYLTVPKNYPGAPVEPAYFPPHSYEYGLLRSESSKLSSSAAMSSPDR